MPTVPASSIKHPASRNRAIALGTGYLSDHYRGVKTPPTVFRESGRKDPSYSFLESGHKDPSYSLGAHKGRPYGLAGKMPVASFAGRIRLKAGQVFTE